MENLQSQFQLMEDALRYIDVSGNLQKIKHMCEKYYSCKPEQDLLIYTFRIMINPTDLMELSVYLGNSLLTGSMEVSEVFQKVVYSAVMELHLLPETISLSQISLQIRLTSLPVLHNWNKIEKYTDLVRYSSCCGFVSFTGIVIGTTAKSKYTQSTRYICPQKTCEGHTGNHFIRIHRPGASEAQTIRKDFTCTFCWSTLEEVKSCRILSDKVVADMVPESCFRPGLKNNCKEQAIPVYVRDDLCSLLELGQVYSVIGLIRKDIQNEYIITTVEVQVNELLSTSQTMNTFQEDLNCLHWRMPIMLAYYFGANVSPPGSYIKLKLAILLSLANCGQESPIHLICIGKDVNILHQLLMYGQNFCNRICMHASGNHFAAKVTPDKYNSAEYYVEGGSAFLARGGICYLGYIGKYKKKTKDKFHSAMTSGKLVTEVNSKFTSGLPQVLESPLRCQIWGYHDANSNRKQQNDDLFVGCDTGDIERTLLDAFSLIQFTDSCDSTTNDDVATCIAEQILCEARECQTDCNNYKIPMSDEDVFKYLQTVRQIHPTMTKQAETLIHSYYVASRKARSNNQNSCNVPSTALSTLLLLSTNHARLCMNNTVEEKDALVAIKLYEESLISRFGCSMINILPSPHIPVSSKDEILKLENEDQMNQLHVQLLKFCSKQSSHEE